MKRFAFALFCTIALVGYVVGAEFTATITKVTKDGDKYTVDYTKAKTKKMDEVKATLPATGAKVFKADVSKDADTMKNVYKDGAAIDKDLANEMFTADKIGDKGVQARIFTDGKDKDEKIVKILILEPKKGKKGGG
jgi:hypothetical protein